jgi:mRNA degradation ribonuclease J1/J2
VKELVYLTLSEMSPEVISDKALVQAKVRSVLKKYLRNTMDRKPMIMPLIFEV